MKNHFSNEIPAGQPRFKVYEFGAFRLEAASRLLFRETEIVALAPKAVEVLLALVEAGGQVVKKEEILETVWAGSFVEEANLTHHISALRKTLGEDESGRRFIETIPRKGYRFAADVREAASGAAEIVISERTVTRITEEATIEIKDEPLPAEKVVRTEAAPPSPFKTKNRRGAALAASAFAAVAVFAAVGYAVYQYAFPAPLIFEAKRTTRVTATGKVSIAAVAPDGKLIAYAQEEDGERQSLWIRHITTESSVQVAPTAAVEYRGLTVAPDGDSIYYVVGQGALYRISVFGGAPRKVADGLYTGGGGKVSIGIAPDGKRIAFVRRFENDASALFVVNADGGSERKLAAFEQPVRLSASVDWSPDGKIIACRQINVAGHNVLAVNAETGGNAPVLPQDWNAAIRQAVWMPDSKSLLMITGEKMYQVFYPGGGQREIGTGADQRLGIDLTKDGRSLMTVKTEIAAHVWTMPIGAGGGGDASRAKQLTHGFEKADGLHGLGWMSGGKIVYDSDLNGARSIWTVETNGAAKQIVKDGGAPAVSPDSRFIVYQKGSEAAAADIGLRQVNRNDGGEKRLTGGADVWQTFSPDGEWLVFTRYAERVGLWKAPSAGGGDAALILDANAICPTVSPDGKLVAFIMRRAGEANRIALVSIDGGEIIRTFDANLERNRLSDKQNLQWTADGSGVYYVAQSGGVSNVWRQPTGGGAPALVTNFAAGRIFNFAFSPDGAQLALARGDINSDVVLIENARE